MRLVSTAGTVFGLALALLGLAISIPDDESPVLLVANKQGNSLSFVNVTTHQVENRVTTGAAPHEVAAAPGRQRAYVANYDGGTITVIDVSARRVETTWPLTGYSRPHGIAVGPDEERVYVTAEDARAVLELDAERGNVLRTFETGKDGTHMLALSSNGRRLYATSIGSGTLSIIHLKSGRVETHIRTGEGAEGVAVHPKTGEVWVTNRADDTVAIIDTDRAAVTDTLSVAGFPIRTGVHRSGTHAVVSTPRLGGVVVLDAQNPAVETRIETGAKPIGVLPSPRKRRAFIANSGSKTVSIVDLESATITDTIRVGRGPDGMAFLAADERPGS